MRTRLIALALLLPVVALGQQRYHDPELHWSFVPAPQWEEMPRERLSTIEAEMTARMPQRNFTFVKGFQHRKDPQNLFLLVQHTPAPGRGRLSDIEKGLGAVSKEQLSREVGRAMPELGSGFEITTPVLDREKLRIELNIDLGDAQRGVAAGYLTKGGIVQLNGYAPSRDWEQRLPEIRSMIDSFRVDAGHEFEATSVGTSAGRGALIGATVGTVVAVIAGLRKKKEKKGAAPS